MPEFSSSKIITFSFSVNHNEMDYDAIIGRDLMKNLGMNISFGSNSIEWEGVSIPMKDFNQVNKWRRSKLDLNLMIKSSEEPVATKQATNRIVKILDSNYSKANLAEIVRKTNHLTKREQEMLYELLKKYEDIFDGTLGQWRTEPVTFELKEGAVPHSQRHFPVPHIYKETFKKELDRLESLDVLERVQQSEWGSPTFIIPKKDNKVRFISDFRKLNQKIKRKPYPLPRISETLQQIEGYKYATSLDLNMGYYHIPLSPEASEMCTIITEYGKYRYKTLPMGV